MGHKTHPIGFRLGIIKEWDARWFAPKASDFRKLLQEDFVIRGRIQRLYPDAGIAKVEIERGNQDLNVYIHTSRPGIVIGRQGQRVEQLRTSLEEATGKRIRVNIQEMRQPEMSATLVARNIADQLARRIAFRRAIRQAATRTMQAGAQGIKIICSGRLGGAEIARKEKFMLGRVPLHTLRADIDYGLAEAATNMGRIGVKVWLYKGEILPTPTEVELEEMGPIQVTVTSEDEETAVQDAPVEESQAPRDDAEMGPIQVTVTSEDEETAVQDAPVEESQAPRDDAEMEPVQATVTSEGEETAVQDAPAGESQAPSGDVAVGSIQATVTSEGEESEVQDAPAEESQVPEGDAGETEG